LAEDSAILASGVYKRFRRGEQFDSLRDLIAARILRRRRLAPKADFWAVNDVSFQVRPGESFGIIGPNGAGKSTILKLLAGIMLPTQGRVEVNGRVSALIELGAGFHGDLTGRENIYLNASILGMSRQEARRKFDEMVDFAGIEDFIDTPVKRYSSGMYARLGFAIAAHVDPHVLLVDEVLSVGDRVFRARCLEKMRSFLAEGVAIVFVSHDLGTVSRFCDRAMVLVRGGTSFLGSAGEAVGHYYQACAEPLLITDGNHERAVHVTDVRVCRPNETAEAACVRPGERVTFRFRVGFDVDMASPSFGFSIIRMDDHLVVFETSSTRLGTSASPARRGDCYDVRYDFDMNLPAGEYAVGLHVRDRDALKYAIQDGYMARILVDAPVTSGGMAHLAPRVSIAKASSRAIAAASA